MKKILLILCCLSLLTMQGCFWGGHGHRDHDGGRGHDHGDHR